ncbi:DeoR/GlpR family DNA-binding transcription regulator [Olivibacter sp. XZL3]|uniref:DeoR/GlpR family DNA-binding transcription regulator n=1 Tax=Olivibacter sp. XZL3 TaxID=1735116 RepID=UPI001066B3AF|nr:DeoR/GlpR family DNA-binding transcription regulator [Olivibacter sp. XZL3]
MIKEERFEIILKLLEKEVKVSYEKLAELLSVSEDTVRRDVDNLYRNGLLSKVKGGAMLRSKDPLSFQDRSLFSTDEKSAIALKALKFIKNGQTLFMDGGTTICAIAKVLPRDIAVRIVTNNMELIPILKQFPNVELVVLGGIYHLETAITTGAQTVTEASQFIANVYFMGTCAVDYQFGVSATVKADCDVKRAMIASSRKTIVLADSNKLRKTEPFKAANMSEIDILISDIPSDHDELKEFRNLDIQLV